MSENFGQNAEFRDFAYFLYTSPAYFQDILQNNCKCFEGRDTGLRDAATLFYVSSTFYMLRAISAKCTLNVDNIKCSTHNEKRIRQRPVLPVHFSTLNDQQNYTLLIAIKMLNLYHFIQAKMSLFNTFLQNRLLI